MDSLSHRQYRFADFLVNVARGALLRDGEEIPLRRQAYEMLVILLEHQGELVSKDFLLDTLWADTVVTENSITQCLKEVRRAIGDDDLSMIRTIPRRGYIFEPPVARIEPESGAVASARAMHGRWLVAAVAVLAVAVAAWWALETSPPAQTAGGADTAAPPAKSVAVLPFINMSPDPDVTFLADGISEEILNQLAQVPDLLVIARTSSFMFRGHDVDIASIGQQLNVAHVLEGSVRVEGDAVRVTAQLVSTGDQAHRWSRSYDRSLENIFDLQKSIAQDVAQQLQIKLADLVEGNPRGAHKPNPEAYAAYLRGQYLMAQRTLESVAGAAGEFGKAVQLDPDYAEAHAGLAITTVFQSDMGHGDLPEQEALARARLQAERALEVDPELAEAHAAMAHVLFERETMEEAFFHYQLAVALRPNYSDGMVWLSNFLLGKGRYEESLELLERALRSDPLSVAALWNYCVTLLSRGRIEEAEVELNELSTLAPGHYRDLLFLFRALDGQWAQAALALLEAKLENPADAWLDSMSASFLAAMGLAEEVLAIRVDDPSPFELLGRPQDIVSAYEEMEAERDLKTSEEWILGGALAAAGDYERALPYLEDNWSHVNGVVATPWFDASAVLALMGARRESGEDPGSEDLAAALRESAGRYRDAGMVECIPWKCVHFEVAIASYLSGDRQSAVNLLSRAVSSGYLIPPNTAYLRFLYDDPDLAQIFERQRAHVLTQRQEFLQAICPENPYADVWQPAAGTCEAIAAEPAITERERKPGK